MTWLVILQNSNNVITKAGQCMAKKQTTKQAEELLDEFDLQLLPLENWSTVALVTVANHMEFIKIIIHDELVRRDK